MVTKDQSLNSQVGAYAEILISLIRENPLALRRDSVEKDAETVLRRLSAEGMPFATQRLPLLAKSLEQALENGQYVVPFGFRKSKKAPGLPAFMQDVLLIIFDENGVLRPVVDWTDMIRRYQTPDNTVSAQGIELDRIAKAVAHLRQVCYMFYKLDLPFPEETKERAVGGFIAIDEELPEAYDSDDQRDKLLFEAAYEIERLWEGLDLQAIRPGHGPGAVATGETGDEKWTFRRTYDHLTPVYGLSYFTVGGSNEMADRKDWVDSLDHLPGGAATLCLVPKDSRGPRLISEEPLELQWIQQGQKDALVPIIERNSRKRVNFRDQGINARLALESSVSRKHATLDLKDASDRVSLALFERLCPEAHKPFLLASRSAATTLPNGEVMVLRKFAPMGSAVCFPVEASFFWAIAVAAISLAKPGRRQWVRDNCYTYGDDLIVPREYAAVVADALESVGLRVNRDKSFVNGFFRESCGTDALSGINVTPIRCKKTLPNRKSDQASHFVSTVALAGNLSSKGYKETSELIYRRMESLLGPLPYGTVNSGYLCRVVETELEALLGNLHLALQGHFRARFNSDYQRYEFRVFAPKKAVRETVLDSWERLLRNLTRGPGEKPDEVSLRKDLISLRRRWSAI